MNTAVIVPALNAGSIWKDWINALLATGVNVSDIYIVDSGSSDNTVQQAIEAGFNVKQIVPGAFNHGGTRQLVVTGLADYDSVVFLTQDAILSGTDSIQKILLPLNTDTVGAVCGRQLPRQKAGAIEAHVRLFNYQETSVLNSTKDFADKGLKTAFISNSFAAYRISTLNEIGGFPDDVIFGEDMYVATKLLMANYEIAYVADACVCHSHSYSLWQEIKRYFDMGVFHAHEPWIRQGRGGA
jgi:rhamnosyltransferase